MFGGTDPRFASAALQHAVQLFDFAAAVPGSFAASVPEMGGVYPSSAWRDDLAWAAAWLHVATADRQYLHKSQFWLNESRLFEGHRCGKAPCKSCRWSSCSLPVS